MDEQEEMNITSLKKEEPEPDLGRGPADCTGYANHVEEGNVDFQPKSLKKEEPDDDYICGIIDNGGQFQKTSLTDEAAHDNHLFCEHCRSFYINKCETHGSALFIADAPVPMGVDDRARQTLPPDLEVRKSGIPNAGLGVFNISEPVPVGAYFGPYQGDLVEREEAINSDYSWVIHKKEQGEEYIDGRRETHSNWMRYVNYARNEVEQNLVAFQYRGGILYRCCHPIAPGQELLVSCAVERYDGGTFDKCFTNGQLKTIGNHTVPHSAPLAQTYTAMERKWDSIYALLARGSYPLGYNKSQRQNLRRYASKFQLKDGELFFNCQRRVIRTKEEAKIIFHKFHSPPVGCHTGVNKSRLAICSRFYWHGMSVDIENWVLECDKCQKVGKSLMAVQPLQCFKVSAVWELVGIDVTGPLPKTADGFQYILTATDYFSKWVEAFALKSTSAAEVGSHLCSIIYRHGCPKRILSDLGKEFVNELNLRMCNLLHIERSITAAYHPQTNSLDKKTNNNIKRALEKLVNEKQNDWDVFLEATLFSLRSKVHTTTKYSPFFLMYGREAVFPSEIPADVPLSNIVVPDGGYGDFLDSKKHTVEAVKETAQEKIRKSREKQKMANDKKIQKKNRHIAYTVGDEVLLLNMKRGRKGGRIKPDFHAPYTIHSISGKLVRLRNHKGAILKTKYNSSHLKPYRRSQDGNDLQNSVSCRPTRSLSNVLPPISSSSIKPADSVLEQVYYNVTEDRTVLGHPCSLPPRAQIQVHLTNM